MVLLILYLGILKYYFHENSNNILQIAGISIRIMNSTTHHLGENYELYAFLRDHELQLVLKVRKDLGKYTIFKTILDNESLEKLMEKNLRDIEIIYEYLKEKESFVVKEQEGKIVLKTIMTVGKKVITSES